MKKKAKKSKPPFGMIRVAIPDSLWAAERKHAQEIAEFISLAKMAFDKTVTRAQMQKFLRDTLKNSKKPEGK